MGKVELVTITELAADQWGLVTAAQAQQVGVSRMQLARLVDDGVLDRVAHGVYATPVVLGDRLLGLRAAWIGLQPRLTVTARLADPVSSGVVSHASAANLHGLGDLLSDVHELTLPRRFQSVRPGVLVHRAALETDDVTVVDGLPVTTAARTVADLVAAGHDLEHVGQVAADAVRQGSATRRTLSLALESVAKRRGAQDGAELAAMLLRAGGLSQMVASAYEGELTVEPQAAEAIETIAALIIEVLGRPEVRARIVRTADAIRSVLGRLQSAASTVLAPVTPSPEARRRLIEILSDPHTQKAIGEVLTQMHQLALMRAAPLHDEDDVPEQLGRAAREAARP